MNTVEDVNNRIVLNGDILLPKMMGKIDVLSPILNLQDREEDLVLDLHYSLSNKRTWNAHEARVVAYGISQKMINRWDYVQEEICNRFNMTGTGESLVVINDWKNGLETIATWPLGDDTIFWERIADHDEFC